MAHDPLARTSTAPPADTTRPTLTGSFGMTASTHWLATGAAQSVLERGGNAFDAAVAAAFVLHVVEPHLNGPGGDLVAIIAPASGGVQVVNGQGPAPRGATIEHFRREGLTEVPGAGALAAAVPGAVASWLDLLAEHGTWELADVLAYAIHYAETGHAAGRGLCNVIATMAEQFITRWPTSAAQWLRGGAAPEPGQVITNKAYAQTLRRLLACAAGGGSSRGERIGKAAEAWRSGFVASAIAEFAATAHWHSSGTDHAGVIAVRDFEEFRPAYEAPMRLEFRGITVAKPGFWAQGPVLLQTLAILDTVDERRLDPSTALGAHTILEALKLALADRDCYYGEAGREPRSLTSLLSPDYARERAAAIGETASHDYRPGRAPGLEPRVPPLLVAESPGQQAGVGEPTVFPTGDTRGDTSHLDVVDRWGNMVSATPSGGWLQSSPTVPALGFCLGTRLQMTWLDPESPSGLRPGRRPRTTLSPTLLLRDGQALAALGTPGGDQQDQWQLLYLLRTLVGRYTPQQAIDAPAFHTVSAISSFWPRVWTPGGAVVERRLGSEVIEELLRRGHRVTVSSDWSLGRLSTVTRDPATGFLSAAANARGAQGYAAGR
ncbi:gamma-glutamyltransferase family protein [Saccharopolyspora phatthalungensis]|uniref:Gamma-glutamyltranspeptidase/glutathione hydrolase n=1 Tax=Saccharopolyspora phatthalungensis TaxID=664693 RepID=A0A840QFB2_9PSEU|nr:gamma-glutamyltransferase [Saccharopolyspora phatthalungensis]MBB5159116.1 gamma-glutamyltranspeptidase/glutathione hydrolase [Saccharopolyspora phatthalungensis]